METIHTLKVKLDWKLIEAVSEIDRFDGSWGSIEKREGKSLKELKSIATVQSVGASTRIEGSKMTDEEVDVLLKDLSLEKLIERDSQEVAGYYEVVDVITESFNDIEISENSLKNLHNQLMKYSKKDEWHKGDYKQLSNSVEVITPDGAKQTIFKTTSPGVETQDAMRSLIKWYHEDNDAHELVKTALFVYEFVSIHPFQDGNGRLSRLLSTLLLMKRGYRWIQYVSFEHEIENRKNEYYRELRKCQAQRPNEEVTSWIYFFFNCLTNVQNKLMKKLEVQGVEAKLSPRDKSILVYIGEHPGSKSGDISLKLDIPIPTVKKALSKLVEDGLIERFGAGAGTNYSVT